MRRATRCALACVAALCVTSSARANGRFPASNQILFSPASSSTIVVRSTFGILFSTDAGTSWRWLCEDTLGLPPTSNEDPYLGITATGNLVAGLSLGLEVSTDSGCGWDVAGGALAGQHIKDLDVRTDDAHTIELITSTYGVTNGADGGPGYTQQTFESTDDGAHWTPFGVPIDPAAVVTTVDVAPSDPSRLYVSAFRGQGTGRTASLFVSKDKGAHWTEYPVPLDPAHETAVYIGAVDPTNEDVVYVRSEGQSTVSVTRNGGQSFTTLKQLDDEMLGLALSQDGSKLYIGSVADGLLMAPTATATPTFTTMNANLHVQCLITRGTDLWACSDEVSGFVAGVSQDDGKTFTPKLHLLQIAGPIQCGASAQASQCTAWDNDAGLFYNPFVGLCSNLGACYDGGPPEPLISECACTGACTAYATSDSTAYHPSASCPDGGSSGSSSGSGGSGGAGSSGGTETVAGGSTSGSSCTIVAGTGAAGAFAVSGALGIAALVARRRRRGRRGSR